jgi:hypothetical protein
MLLTLGKLVLRALYNVYVKEHEVSVVSLLPHIMYYLKRLVFSEHTHLRDILILVETFSYLQFVIVLNVDTSSYLQTYRNTCAEETCPYSGTDTSQPKARKDLLVETCTPILLTNVLRCVRAEYVYCVMPTLSSLPDWPISNMIIKDIPTYVSCIPAQ